MIPFRTQERVHLPWLMYDGKPIEGTVTAIEPSRFRITWDSHHRKSSQARTRSWYPAYAAPRFRRGNATGMS